MIDKHNTISKIPYQRIFSCFGLLVLSVGCFYVGIMTPVQSELGNTFIMFVALMFCVYPLYTLKEFRKWIYGIIEALFALTAFWLVVYLWMTGKGPFQELTGIVSGMTFIVAMLAPMYVCVRAIETIATGVKEENKRVSDLKKAKMPPLSTRPKRK